jgi:hypothetical protein
MFCGSPLKTPSRASLLGSPGRLTISYHGMDKDSFPPCETRPWFDIHYHYQGLWRQLHGENCFFWEGHSVFTTRMAREN